MATGIKVKRDRMKTSPLSTVDKRALESTKDEFIYIYNIYRYEHTIFSPYNSYPLIPACKTNGSVNPEDWDAFGEPLVIPKTVVMLVANNKAAYLSDPVLVDGREIAEDILGIFDPVNTGMNFHNRNKALTKWGCFVSASNPPTKNDMAAAKERLTNHLKKLVAQGNRYYAGNQKEKDLINYIHRDAASYLRVNVPWSDIIQDMQDCPLCRRGIPAKAVKCSFPDCGAILDEDKWLKTQPQFILTKHAEKNKEKAK